MKALVVVDYQNDFVDGSLGFEGAKLLEPLIVERIAEYRRQGGRIIFTFDTHGENYLDTAEGRKLPVRHCIEGTEGHKLYGRVADCLYEDDILITKGTFGSLELAEFLAGKKYTEVELCGLVTDICVLSNAVLARAALPESRIVVDGRLCASADREAHEAALRVLKSVQVDVI